ncbi:LLM class flavin-dependent oxidoreductase [soil metagenome]
MIDFSVLDLSPIGEGSNASQALHNTLDVARHVERLGYRRYWLAEHHNMPGIASAATAVVIGHVAGGTESIRVGSGGVMLPNHAPLVIAEQFGTLAALYPGRIELGLGRAPCTDQMTARALRRDMLDSAEQFPQDVQELMRYFDEPEPGQHIRAVPGAGLHVPIWLLGSSLYSAQLAAMLGLRFAFASHFAPDALMQALQIYRTRFQPSAELAKPYAMVACNIVAAPTDEEAKFLFSSMKMSFVRLRRGNPGLLPAPREGFDEELTAQEKAMLDSALACSFVGSPATIEPALRKFLDRTGADELIVNGQIHDHQARLRSFTLAAEVRDSLRVALPTDLATAQ